LPDWVWGEKTKGSWVFGGVKDAGTRGGGKQEYGGSKRSREEKNISCVKGRKNRKGGRWNKTWYDKSN